LFSCTDSEVAKCVKQTIDSLPRYQPLVSQLNSMCGDGAAATVGSSSSDSVHRTQGKMERALERLRRACIRVFDAGKVEKLDKVTKVSVTNLLEGIVKVLEADIKDVSVAIPSFTLFCLAQTLTDWEGTSTFCRSLQGHAHNPTRCMLCTRPSST